MYFMYYPVEYFVYFCYEKEWAKEYSESEEFIELEGSINKNNFFNLIH